MFDIGFQELVLIMIVALLVIGPERLPGLARKAGLWLGKARRFISSVKQDIDRELAAEELKRIIEEQKKSASLHEIIEETKDTFEEAKQEYLVKSVDEINEDVQSLEQDLNEPVQNQKSAKQADQSKDEARQLEQNVDEPTHNDKSAKHE